MRVTSVEEATRLEVEMRGLRPHLEGTTLEVTGGMNRPPMVRTSEIVALFTQAEAFAEEMGFEITESGTGGGSDGNFTAALGVPTLDGMGPVGDGAHALHEYVYLHSLPERAALLAAMIRSPEAYLPAIRGLK